MSSMDPIEFNEMLKKMRKGERVTCPLCKKGVMIPVGDYKTTHCFKCDTCSKKMNLN